MKQLQQRIEEVGAMLKEHLDLTNKVGWIETEDDFSKFMTDTILGTIQLTKKLGEYDALHTKETPFTDGFNPLTDPVEQPEFNLSLIDGVRIIPSSPLSENVPGDY